MTARGRRSRRFPLYSIFVVWLICLSHSSSHHSHHQHCIGIPLPPVFKLASVISCRFSMFSSLTVLSPTTHVRARDIIKTLFLKVCIKLSLIGLKLDMRSYLDIGRPPPKFRCKWSPPGTRTVDRSGTVFGLSSDVFRCFKSRSRVPVFPLLSG